MSEGKGAKMRAKILAAAAGLAALPAMAGVPMPQGAATASPVATQPLAANEVLVELSATGTATSRADLATVGFSFVSRGATEEEARRAHDERVERLRALGRGAGVAASDIEVDEAVSLGALPDFSLEMAVDPSTDMGPDTGETVEEPPPEEPATSRAVQGRVTFQVRDVARVEAFNQALMNEGSEEGLVPEIAYTVSDDAPARREARAQAIAAARADADAYASAMGMRVARIVRVSERSGMDLMSMMFTNPAWAQQIEQLGQPQGPDIPVRVVVGVDFALAPR